MEKENILSSSEAFIGRKGTTLAFPFLALSMTLYQKAEGDPAHNYTDYVQKRIFASNTLCHCMARLSTVTLIFF